MKFLVYLVTFIVCIAILAGGVVLTIQNNDLVGFADDFNEAMKTEPQGNETPVIPNDPQPTPDIKPGDNTGEGDGEIDEELGGDGEGEGDQTPEDTKKPEDAENLKELFGILYSQYTPVSQEIQEKALKNIIESNMDISNNKNKAYLEFIDVYTSALYEEIASLKGDEQVDPTSPEELEKETSFVQTEAPAYECFLDIMGGVVVQEKEYKPSSYQINEAVETMIQSQVCKNTINSVTSDSGLVSTTQKAIEHLDPEVVGNIENALNEHLNDSELSEDVCRGLAKLFGLTLK